MEIDPIKIHEFNFVDFIDKFKQTDIHCFDFRQFRKVFNKVIKPEEDGSKAAWKKYSKFIKRIYTEGVNKAFLPLRFKSMKTSAWRKFVAFDGEVRCKECRNKIQFKLWPRGKYLQQAENFPLYHDRVHSGHGTLPSDIDQKYVKVDRAVTYYQNLLNGKRPELPVCEGCVGRHLDELKEQREELIWILEHENNNGTRKKEKKEKKQKQKEKDRKEAERLVNDESLWVPEEEVNWGDDDIVIPDLEDENVEVFVEDDGGSVEKDEEDKDNKDDLDLIVADDNLINEWFEEKNEVAVTKRRFTPVKIENYPADILVKVRLVVEMGRDLGLITDFSHTLRLPLRQISTISDNATHRFSQTPKETLADTLKELMQKGYVFMSEDGLYPDYFFESDFSIDSEIQYDQFNFVLNSNRINWNHFYEYETDLGNGVLVIHLRKLFLDSLCKILEDVVESNGIKGLAIGTGTLEALETLTEETNPYFAVIIIMHTIDRLIKQKGTREVKNEHMLKMKLPKRLKAALTNEGLRKSFCDRDKSEDRNDLIKNTEELFTPEFLCLANMLNYPIYSPDLKTIDDAIQDFVRSKVLGR